MDEPGSQRAFAWEFFSAQHGVATIRQLLDRGLSRKRISTLVKQGMLRHECYGLVSLAGAPRTSRFMMMFGVLVAGARSTQGPVSSAIWGPTAAMEHDLIEP
nr:type IV toxin-antitoxin system AbiEi family antitoxin domain-containing protein [Actinomycetota bacterium]